MHRTTAQSVEVSEDLNIHYEISGAGDNVVLFVPGWTMSSAVFSEQLSFFENSTRYRFMTYDPRSHGLSTKSASGHFYEQHGRDLHNLIEALGLDQIVLGGWSAACLTILSYVNQYGAGRLSGLIMIDGAPRWKGPDNISDWINYRYDDADGSEERFTMGPLRDREAFNQWLAEWMLEDSSPDNIAWIANIANQTPDTVAALLNATGCFLDFRADLRRLEGKLPLLYVVREEKGQVVANWAGQNTPSARVEVFGKHLMFRERSKQFNALLADYLAAIN